MSRVYNFGAGPAMLPAEVIERAAEGWREWRGLGMSVAEMSHRGAEFRGIAESAEAALRRLLALPERYRVLFVHGPARLQFSAVPLNLLGGRRGADYVDTGIWSRGAIEEGRRYADVNVVASAADTGYDRIPPLESWRLGDDPAYLHYTPNETIGGVEFHDVPEVGGRDLVADMSSTLLSRPLDVERFALVYAGAQKNLGVAGLTVVIVREDLLGRASPATPAMLDYSVHAGSGSLACTAPTFAWYVAGLVFEWIEAQGGLAAMGERNRRKAETLYRFIDDSNYYRNPVDPPARSWMNVPFTLPDPALDGAFLAAAGEAGLVGLKGHRFVGGMRASLYNAMPQAGVDALIDVMREFARRHG